MMNERRNISGAFFGLLLIGLGIIFLAGQFIDVRIGAFLWPFVVIAFGGMFFVGMLLGGPSAGGLAIPGSIIAMIGLILLGHNTFGHWEGWSYDWTLILIAVGIGLVIRGYWSHMESSRSAGWNLIKIGAIFFVLFGAFFELVIGFGDRTLLNRAFWPLALIGVGAYLLISRMFKKSNTTSYFPPEGGNSYDHPNQ
jgi:hypothetical protein